MIEKLKKQIEFSRAVGFAIGVLNGILFVDRLTESQIKAIKEAIEGLENLKNSL
jgi:hypothetical protein